MSFLLIDLDNCLTPPRQPMLPEMTETMLSTLEKHIIGIITGSHYAYLQEQIGNLSHPNIQLLPINGTQKYEYAPEVYEWKQTYVKKISDSVNVAELEACLQTIPFLKEFTQTGVQVQLREGAINLCPIGRSADVEKRQAFVEYDKKTGFRQKHLPVLTHLLEKYGCVAVFGGQTSFDIYPKGWDKSHALTHFPADLFIGDALYTNGNDECMLSHLPCVSVRNWKDTQNVLKML